MYIVIMPLGIHASRYSIELRIIIMQVQPQGRQ